MITYETWHSKSDNEKIFFCKEFETEDGSDLSIIRKGDMIATGRPAAKVATLSPQGGYILKWTFNDPSFALHRYTTMKVLAGLAPKTDYVQIVIFDENRNQVYSQILDVYKLDTMMTIRFPGLGEYYEMFAVTEGGVESFDREFYKKYRVLFE